MLLIFHSREPIDQRLRIQALYVGNRKMVIDPIVRFANVHA